MNINNNLNTAVTRVPNSIKQTTDQSLFDCTRITNCANNSKTCLTIARIGCLAGVGATVGATVIGPGLSALLSTKLTCESVSVGAISGAMLAVYEAATDKTDQNAEPVTTQPGRVRRVDSQVV